MLPESEKACVAIVLDRNDLAHILFDNLTSEYFHGPTAIVFDAMVDLRRDGLDVQWATVRDHVGPKVNPSFWGSLLDATRGIHSSGYEPFLRERIGILKAEFGKRRALAIVEQAVKKPAIGEDDIAALDETVRGMRTLGTEREASALGEAINAYQEHIRQERSGITLGFPTFDKLIDGFNPGELVTIMARPSVGKTFLALNIINRLAATAPFRLALFSLEMPKAAIIERLLEVFFGASRYEVKDRALDGSLMIGDFEAQFAKLSIYDRIYSVAEIRQIIEREGYRVVFIDFLGLIRSEIIGSPYQQVSAIIAGLKQMAKDTASVVFMMLQLSRRGSLWEPVEIDMARDSGQAEELSDFIIGAWNPGLAPDAPEGSDNTLVLRLLKNKRDTRAVIQCHFEKMSGRITELEHFGGGE